ncbi:fluoride efflux transporter CrcB [Pseudoroseicyclus sp. H15]
MLNTLGQVAIGGALGASCRYLVGLGTLRLMGPGFPYGTLAVNILGSFIMGGLIVVLAELSANRFAPFLMTGLLGGFTTFSAFSLDAITLFERGQPGTAGLYVVLSLVLSVSACVGGLLLARSLT